MGSFGGGLEERIREEARALGFEAFGIARADEPLGVEHERYERFVEAGMHGEMGYLARNAEARRRLDGDAILPGARSVVCVGKRYGRSEREEANDPPLARAIARYARGQDYHKFLRRRLRRLAAFVRGLGEGVEARPILDVEPVLERAWAARSGLGFVGKHGLVITPGQGSYQLLGEVVTTLELRPGTPMTERCGSCTRCLDACPTSAFVAPFVLDPRRCVSYFTIEVPSAPPPGLEAAIGERLFGCDACQEACPYNRAAPPEAEATRPFSPHARWGELSLVELARAAAEGGEAFSRLAEGSPLARPGPSGLAKNAVMLARSRLRADPENAEARAALALGREAGGAAAELAARPLLPSEAEGEGNAGRLDSPGKRK